MTSRDIETERLRLVRPSADHLEDFVAFFGSPRAAARNWRMTRAEGWRFFAELLGHWQIRGFGWFIAEDRRTDAPIGTFGPWQPEGRPEAEIAWTLWDEGCGPALEAATAARDHAYDTLGWSAAVSYIRLDNARSIALARRLGGMPDPDAPRPKDDVVVYRHPRPA